MKYKYINIESKFCLYLIVFIFIIAVIYSIFPSLSFLSFTSCGILPALGTICAGFLIKDCFDCGKIARQLYNGDFLSVAAIMDGLQKIDKKTYKKVMLEYEELLEKKISDNELYVYGVREEFFNDIIKGKDSSFCVKEEENKLRKDKKAKELLCKIKKGQITWETVYKNTLDSIKYKALLLHELGESEDDEVYIKAKKDAETIKLKRKQGLTIHIN